MSASANLLNHRYRVIRSLAEGGFGKTFLVEDTQMPSRRQCVIKQLKPMNDRPEVFRIVQDRFAREAAVLESVGKGNSQIPDLYAYFEEVGQFYLVQEWIEGQPLSQLTRTPWAEAAVEKLLTEVLEVLTQVHQQKIIHRDIKPDNIILRTADQRPCLIDFGAVKELMSTVTHADKPLQSSLTIGTPGFMPPEQAAGHPVFASDLYSLAMTAIYLLTGKTPHGLPTHSQTGQVLWQQFVPTVSHRLAVVLNRATDMTAKSRYGSAADMATALRSSSGAAADTAISPSPVVLPAAAMTTSPPPTKRLVGLFAQSKTIPWKPTAIVAGGVAVVGGLLFSVGPRLPFAGLTGNETPTPTAQALKRSLSQTPDDVQAQVDLASAYRREADYAAAESQLAPLLEEIPESVPVLAEQGQLQLAQENYVEAIATFSRVLAQAEDHYEARAGRRDAYQAVGEFEDAFADYRLARKSDPDNSYLLQMLEQLDTRCAPLTITTYQSQTLISPDGNTQVHAEGDMRKTVDLDHPINSEESCIFGHRKTVRSELIVSRNGETFPLVDERASDDSSPVENDRTFRLIQPVSFSPEGRYLVAELYDARSPVVSQADTNIAIFDLEERTQVDISNRCSADDSDRYIGFVSATDIFIDCKYFGGYYPLSREQADEPPIVSIDVSSGVGTPVFEYREPVQSYGTRSGKFSSTQEPAAPETAPEASTQSRSH